MRILSGEYRKTDTLYHHFVIAKSELKDIHRSFDEIVEEIAEKLKGVIKQDITTLLKAGKKIKENNIEQTLEAISSFEDVLVEAESIQKDLEDAVSTIVGMELPHDEAKRVLEILQNEAKQLNRLISKGNLLKTYVKAINPQDGKFQETLTTLKHNYEDLLLDFSLFQDYLTEKVPLLDELMNTLEEGIKVTAKYKNTGKI